MGQEECFGSDENRLSATSKFGIGREWTWVVSGLHVEVLRECVESDVATGVETGRLGAFTTKRSMRERVTGAAVVTKSA